MKYKIFTDGGARGNPGPAGAGVQVVAVWGVGEGGGGTKGERQSVIYEQASCLGRATNNEAEYKAFLAALEWLRDRLVLAVENGGDGEGRDGEGGGGSGGEDGGEGVRGLVEQVEFYLDSKLVVEQVLKNWKLKEPRLKELAEKAWELMAELEELGVELSLAHVGREQNKGADSLVNRALDVA